MHLALLSSLLFVASALLVNQTPRKRAAVIEHILYVLSLCGMVATFYSDVYGPAAVAVVTTLCVIRSLASVGRDWRPVLYRSMYVVALALGLGISIIELPSFTRERRSPQETDVHDESGRYADGHGGPKTNQGGPGALSSFGAETNGLARAMRMARLSVDSLYGEGSFDKGFEAMRMDRMLRKLEMDVRLHADTNLTLDVSLVSPVPRVYLKTHGSMDD